MEIVTEGDVHVNTINNSRDICNVSTKLSKTLIHLEEFISEQMNDSVQKICDEASVFD